MAFVRPVFICFVPRTLIMTAVLSVTSHKYVKRKTNRVKPHIYATKSRIVHKKEDPPGVFFLNKSLLSSVAERLGDGNFVLLVIAGEDLVDFFL